VATIRNLTPRTIEDHLAGFLEKGLLCDITRLNLSKELYETVASIIETVPIHNDMSKLAPIKKLCPTTVTYAQLKCIIAIKKSMKKDTYFK
jgi:uncharacterized protein YpbB